MAENKQVYDILGLDCPDCARKVADGVKKLPGVQLSELNFATGKLTVMGESTQETITERVRALGYDVAEPENETVGPPKREKNFFRFLWGRTETQLALLGTLLVFPGLVFNEILQMELFWVNLLAVAAVLSAGLPVARSAWRNLRFNHSIDINFLMSIAAVGAIVIGAYVEAGMVMVLFALGEALEGFTSERARASIESLMNVVPQTATRLILVGDEVQEVDVPVEDLDIGHLILVRPGETIPMDGIVRDGFSSVNQAAITGESRLVEKTIGETVFASTFNGEGALEIEVTHRSEENTISRVIKLVQEAQGKQAPAQRFIDRFARWYTPLVVVLAALVAVLPPLIWGEPFLNPTQGEFGWLYRGLTLLVISCPCALVISTPVSIISAISNAARNGVLFKAGLHLETLSKTKVFAFDKTGTLTEGRPMLVAARSTAHPDFQPISGSCTDCADLVALAHAVERRAKHPLAEAIADAASSLQVTARYPAADAVSVLPGLGVSGQVNGQLVQIGSHRLMDDCAEHSQEDCFQLNMEEQTGNTQVHVAVDGELKGSLLATDAVRPSSKQALADLRKLGIKTLVMLTGDLPAAAEQIAAEVGVTDFRSSLLPQDKVNAVMELKNQYGHVVMIGDGINDAPALALADVGIAVGGAGSSAQAIETADITLMQADLSKLPFAYNLSRKTMRIILFNIIFAIGVKAAFMVLATLGYSSMWMAVVADMGISILVTFNGMRLLRYPK
ncbi:MAG: heavy metal translocating P-type ATPase [Anaerolineaceae bacterium]|nr:heavy metal translocating P-type ATPase [Anaerolineaceae bacterium]